MQPEGGWRRAASWGALLLLVLGGVFWRTGEAPPVSKGSEGALDEATMERFSFVETDPEGWRWNVSAAHGQTADGQAVVVNEVAMTIRPPDGSAIHVKADRGSLDLSTRSFSLKNDTAPIQVTSDDGHTLQTAALHWHDRTKTLIADGPVTLRGHAYRIVGEALVVDFLKRQIRVNGSVQTSFFKKHA